MGDERQRFVRNRPGAWLGVFGAALTTTACFATIDESRLHDEPSQVDSSTDAGSREAAGPREAGSTPDAGTVFEPIACKPGGEQDSCSGNELRKCRPTGEGFDRTQCPVGCSASSPLRCLQISPSGVVTQQDLGEVGLVAAKLGSSTSINTSTGSIDGIRAAGPGVISGIGFHVSGNVGVFTVSSIEIPERVVVTLTGDLAFALVAATDIRLDGVIDAQGTCADGLAGPGGSRGATAVTPGSGPGAGGKGGASGNDGGGGGAGHAAAGGPGGPGDGNEGPAGVVYGTAELTSLVGGSGGGSGVNGIAGGGGGGAVQLVAGSSLSIGAGTVTGGVNASGCNGLSNGKIGSGGGSGGAILLEANRITIAANGLLAANGGGGGASNNASAPGQKGTFDTTPAAGGGNSGGAGGAATSIKGKQGTNANNTGGGGGGGVGWIRLNAVAPPQVQGRLSPAIADGVASIGPLPTR